MLDLTDFAVQERPEGNLMVAISRPWYNCSYTMAAKPIKSLELHYTMMHFLIIFVIAAGAKAPRKQVGGSSSAASSLGSPTSAGKNKYAGGNPVKWWPSPKWQKGTGCIGLLLTNLHVLKADSSNLVPH